MTRVLLDAANAGHRVAAAHRGLDAQTPRMATGSMMRKRSAVVSARLTADELALITQAARAAGVSVSAYLRNAAALAALRSCPGATSRELPGGGYVVTWTNVPGCTITA